MSLFNQDYLGCERPSFARSRAGRLLGMRDPSQVSRRANPLRLSSSLRRSQKRTLFHLSHAILLQIDPPEWLASKVGSRLSGGWRQMITVRPPAYGLKTTVSHKPQWFELFFQTGRKPPCGTFYAYGWRSPPS